MFDKWMNESWWISSLCIDSQLTNSLFIDLWIKYNFIVLNLLLSIKKTTLKTLNKIISRELTKM